MIAVLYFDQNANFHTLDSEQVTQYRVPLNGENFQECVAGLSQERDTVLTDGESYFVVPSSILVQTKSKPEPMDLEALQAYFFSDEAVAAALEVSEELLQNADKGSLTYGTSGAKSVYEALRKVGAGPNDNFLDIGCGCGLPVILASHLVKKAKGVDIVPSMIEFGRLSAKRFERTNAEFNVQNIRDLDISDIDIVYVAATTLTADLRNAITEKLSQLRPGAVVISLTYPFIADHLVLVDNFRSEFRWWQDAKPAEHNFLIQVRKAA